MASRKIVDTNLQCVTVSKAEAVELITLLSAQLAGVPAPGNHGGACPEIRIVEHGQIKDRIVFMVIP